MTYRIGKKRRHPNASPVTKSNAGDFWLNRWFGAYYEAAEGEKILFAMLYADWLFYCYARGWRAGGRREFMRRMVATGVQIRRFSKGFHLVGYRLKEGADSLLGSRRKDEREVALRYPGDDFKEWLEREYVSTVIGRVPFSAMLEKWNAHLGAQETPPESKRAFSERLERFDVNTGRTSKGVVILGWRDKSEGLTDDDY